MGGAATLYVPRTRQPPAPTQARRRTPAATTTTTTTSPPKQTTPPPQPALYEAFGLTVVEAMSCGLPTFATAHGGPSEIIRHGRSGFHIDPYHGDQVMWGAM